VGQVRGRHLSFAAFDRPTFGRGGETPRHGQVRSKLETVYIHTTFLISSKRIGYGMHARNRVKEQSVVCDALRSGRRELLLSSVVQPTYHTLKALKNWQPSLRSAGSPPVLRPLSMHQGHNSVTRFSFILFAEGLARRGGVAQAGAVRCEGTQN
jgi:hypothetical protein